MQGRCGDDDASISSRPHTRIKKKGTEKRTYVTGISPGLGNSISRWDRKTDEK